MIEGQPALEFARFEFKYRLDASLRDRVEAALQPFVALDAAVLARPGGAYFVRSLYFDDPSFSAFHSKTEGTAQRWKFRVRSYSHDAADGSPWFLERKGRRDHMVLKHRTPVVGAFDRHAAGSGLSRLLLASAVPGGVRDRFEFELLRRRIRPCVLVDYLRRPYVSRFDPGFRLTFDSDLAAAAVDTMHPERTSLRPLLRGHTVMEIKFRQSMPAWFQRILQMHELRRESISKVCTAIPALGLQGDPA